MNLLEIYIKEILSEEDYKSNYECLKDEELVRVKVRTVCWGSEKVQCRIFSKKQWEKYKKQGYWMGQKK